MSTFTKPQNPTTVLIKKKSKFNVFSQQNFKLTKLGQARQHYYQAILPTPTPTFFFARKLCYARAKIWQMNQDLVTSLRYVWHYYYTFSNEAWQPQQKTCSPAFNLTTTTVLFTLIYQRCWLYSNFQVKIIHLSTNDRNSFWPCSHNRYDLAMTITYST